jgi:hypothetical protein
MLKAGVGGPVKTIQVSLVDDASAFAKYFDWRRDWAVLGATLAQMADKPAHSIINSWRLSASLAAHWNARFRLKSADFIHMNRLLSLDENEVEPFDSQTKLWDD